MGGATEIRNTERERTRKRPRLTWDDAPSSETQVWLDFLIRF